MDDALDRELRALGATLGTALDDRGPAPGAVAAAVLLRLDAEPAGATRAPARPSLRRRLAVATVAAVVALGLTPPVRAAVGEWLGIGAVAVRPGPPEPSSGAPPAASAGISLDAAAELAGLTPVVPPVLGPPDGVEVSADRRVLSLSWGDGDSTVRLDQFADPVSPVYVKTAVVGTTATPITVGGREAWWFGAPHDLVLVAPDGSERTETARVAGPTLVWLDDDGVTFRLEGADRARAAEIAESALGTG
ncbi:hypothetical protein E1212_02420 [Jiangella ureilytica]|uniref:DUF4367 domain-containing protein n=1 Tax=Jiangella ureilytica TaxID=2530374 RepID=A0A4R4RWP7_9ACTN|nr:hypothetical protein [Jiangella ureilytica]TDC54617.1 hypothetical protein E1212_02420 [Jiangella ureilytica]